MGPIAAAGCSDAISTNATTPTSARCSTDTPATAIPSTTVVPVAGSGDRSIGLPGQLPLPLIVHARHDGADSFVVGGVDASGNPTQVFATALGKYDGTFAVGFVDACATPTAALHVAAKSSWHLDFANAKLAPRYDKAKGIAGKGDAVLSYLGPSTSVHITYSGDARFAVATYGAKGTGLLAQSKGAYRGPGVLPPGPVFVAVTAHGAWTIGAS